MKKLFRNLSVRAGLLALTTIWCAANVLAQGGGIHTIFGEFKIDTGNTQTTVPTLFYVVLSAPLSSASQKRQAVSVGGQFRFINVANGEYDLIVELDGQEIVKKRIIVQSPYRSDFRHDIELEWRGAIGNNAKSSTISALYPRPPARQARFDQAMAANKDIEKAIELFIQLLRDDPKDFVAWTELGTLYFKKDKPQEATDAYQKALLEKSDFLPALQNLGKLQVAQKDYANAVTNLEHALTAKPDSAEVNYYLGEAWLGLKKGSKAVGYLNEAIRLDPKGMADAHLRLASLYNAAGYKDRAASEYEQFLAKRPDYPEKDKLLQYIKDNKKAP